MRNFVYTAALLGAAAFGAAASATSFDYRYGNAGTLNPDAYSFTATVDGPLTIYVLNSTGSYLSTLGVKVNGATIANDILPSGSPIFVGTDLGAIHAGDNVEFFINVYDRDDAGSYRGTYYSDTADNADGLNHVFADAHPAEPWIGVPLG